MSCETIKWRPTSPSAPRSVGAGRWVTAAGAPGAARRIGALQGGPGAPAPGTPAPPLPWGSRPPPSSGSGAWDALAPTRPEVWRFRGVGAGGVCKRAWDLMPGLPRVGGRWGARLMDPTSRGRETLSKSSPGVEGDPREPQRRTRGAGLGRAFGIGVSDRCPCGEAVCAGLDPYQFPQPSTIRSHLRFAIRLGPEDKLLFLKEDPVRC